MNKTVFAKEELKSFIGRIETMEVEKKAAADDIKEIYAEAKGRGYDVKTLRQIIRLRKLDKSDYEEMEAMLELYKQALDMVV